MQLKNVIFTILFLWRKASKKEKCPCFLPHYAYDITRLEQTLSNTSPGSHTNYKLARLFSMCFALCSATPNSTRGKL